MLPGEPDPDAAFAQCLRVAREAARLTQQQVAEAMSGRGYPMRQNTISKIEAGDRLVWLGEAVALAEIVGVSLAELAAGPPVPGEFVQAIAERAGYLRRRSAVNAVIAETQAALARAQKERARVEEAITAADQKIESLYRRKGDVDE